MFQPCSSKNRDVFRRSNLVVPKIGRFSTYLGTIQGGSIIGRTIGWGRRARRFF